MENFSARKIFNMKLNIGNKIFGGFLILIVLFAINAIIIFRTGNNINDNVMISFQTVNPSKDAINELITLAHRTRMLATNWVFLQTNDEDKNALRFIVNGEYKTLKEKIEKLMVNWDADSLDVNFKKDSAQRMLMKHAFQKFDSLLSGTQENIMNTLEGFDSYEDATTKLLAGDYVDQVIIPQSNDIVKLLSVIKAKQEQLTKQSVDSMVTSTNRLTGITIILGTAIVIIGFLCAYLLMRSITTPINYIRDVVVKLGRGELVEDSEKSFSNDEIGDMAKATNTLVSGLKATTVFAENIGKGNYATEFTPLSDHDVLGNALINMRDNLSRVAEEDKKRAWTTEGLAKFAEILRSNNTDVQKLCDEIIGNLVKYLSANQGALYIVDDVYDGEEPTMSLLACYAWDKKKYLNQKIYKGEGLAGQAWQEKDMIYLTDVPQNYIRITSGLGDANPTAILIMPLKTNDHIFGVLEIASFSTMGDHEIEFVRRIAESTASTVNSVKVNARTSKLLAESQQMTEEMRAQEEEMRQNMEELQATQEEMQRSQSESTSLVTLVNEKFATIEFDLEGNILKANENFLEAMGYDLNEIQGEHHRIFMPKEERNTEAYRQFWKDLSDGKMKSGEFKRVNKRGEEIWIFGAYAPIWGLNGQIVRLLKIAQNITHYKKQHS
ncbi:MAG: PAS domain S-box protein [Flammeovirgaceae bacterium]